MAQLTVDGVVETQEFQVLMSPKESYTQAEADANADAGAKEEENKSEGGDKKDEGDVIDADFEMVDDDKNNKK